MIFGWPEAFTYTCGTIAGVSTFGGILYKLGKTYIENKKDWEKPMTDLTNKLDDAENDIVQIKEDVQSVNKLIKDFNHYRQKDTNDLRAEVKGDIGELRKTVEVNHREVMAAILSIAQKQV